MSYLLVGAVVLALIILGGRRAPKRREWRFISAALALAAFAGAAAAAVRGGWGLAVVLAVVGLWLSVTTRVAAPRGAGPSPAKGMSLSEARALLGVEANASPAEIRAAYTRLMRMAHPDKGGTVGLAAQLNAARDRLLEG